MIVDSAPSANMSKPVGPIYEFGPFRVDAVKRVLLREGEPVPLTSKVFDTLLVLVQHDGQLLTKDELMQSLWPDSIVEESNLTQNISVLRKALGENPEAHRYIVTVPGRGYKFVAGVSKVGSESMDLIVTERARAWSIVEEEEKTEERGRWLASDETAQLDAAPSSETTPARSTSSAEHLISGIKHHKRAALPTLTILIIAAIAVIMYRAYFIPQSKAITSLAVLPFVNASRDQTMEYLSDGLSESLIDRLSQLPGVKVIARSSSFKYKGQEVDPQEVARALGVQALVLGRVEQRGDSLQVRAELVDAREKTQLWGEHYNRELTDILAVQEEIAKQISEKLRITLTRAQQRLLTKRFTENTKAYQFYLRGRYYWNKRNNEGFERAIEGFHQAIEKDPSYALAYAGVADSYALLANYSAIPRKESYSRAKAAAMRALEIDDTLAEAHTSLAFVIWHEGDFSGGEREFKRAIELNPNYATADHWYGNYLLAVGRRDEALAELKRSLELDPLSLIINTAVGGCYYFRREYDQAITQLRETLEIDANFINAHEFLGAACLQKGMYEEAIAEFQKAVELSGRWEVELSKLGHTYAVSGRRTEARKLLDELKERRTQRQISATNIALVYAGLGEREQAFAWLEKAYQERDQRLGAITTDPVLDSLRSDPRFQDLLRRVGRAP